jgi:hypothetical protein
MAILAAYKAALDEGLSDEVAVDVAIVRYRAFFPTTSETEVRQILVSAIAPDRPAPRTTDNTMKDAGLQGGAHNQALRPDRARSFRMKAEELHTVADGTRSPQARQTLRGLARGYEQLADLAEARERVEADKKASGEG